LLFSLNFFSESFKYINDYKCNINTITNKGEVKKMKLSIKKAKIWKTGNSAVITIPPYLIQNHLKLGEEYDFEVEVEQ